MLASKLFRYLCSSIIILTLRSSPSHSQRRLVFCTFVDVFLTVSCSGASIFYHQAIVIEKCLVVLETYHCGKRLDLAPPGWKRKKKQTQGGGWKMKKKKDDDDDDELLPGYKTRKLSC